MSLFTLIFDSSGPFVDSCTLLPCFSLCLYVFMTPHRKALLFYIKKKWDNTFHETRQHRNTKNNNIVIHPCGYLYMGQVALSELLEHSKSPLLVELPQSIDGPLVQVEIRHQAYRSKTRSI